MSEKIEETLKKIAAGTLSGKSNTKEAKGQRRRREAGNACV